MENLFKKIDQLSDKYIDILEDICNIESPTDYKPGVDAVGNYVIKVAEQHGWKIEKSVQQVAGDAICITMNPEIDAQPVCFSAHMDTVHPLGLFPTPAVHRDEEKIYGPGTHDCKGGIAVSLLAMDALEQVGYKKRPIKLLLQSDEEIGSRLSNKATINYICEQAKDAVAFFNLEGHSHGNAVIRRKGILNFLFKVTGAEAHAARCDKFGANAIVEAAHKIIELEKLKDGEGITCNCGVISGGSVPNTVAGYCEFKVNFRFATKEQMDWIYDFVHKVAEKTTVPGCTCEVEQFSMRAAMEHSEKNVALLEKMNEVYRSCGLNELKGIMSVGGSDAADVTACGIPCVDSIAQEGGMAHNVNEFGYLKTYAEAAKRIASVTYVI